MTVPRINGAAILRFNPASTTYAIKKKLITKTYGDHAGAVSMTSAVHLRIGEQSGSPPDTEQIPKAAKEF